MSRRFPPNSQRVARVLDQVHGGISRLGWQIDSASNIPLRTAFTTRYLKGHHSVTPSVPTHSENGFVISLWINHFGDHDHAWDACLLNFFYCTPSIEVNPCMGIDANYCTIDSRQGTNHPADKVRVPGGVNEIEVCLTISQMNHGGFNGVPVRFSSSSKLQILV